jgi:hypothetical protein
MELRMNTVFLHTSSCNHLHQHGGRAELEEPVNQNRVLKLCVTLDLEELHNVC